LLPTASATIETKPCSTKNTCSMRSPASCRVWPLTSCTRVRNGRSCPSSAGGSIDNSSLWLNIGVMRFMDDALLKGRRERRSVSQPLAPEGLGKR